MPDFKEALIEDGNKLKSIQFQLGWMCMMMKCGRDEEAQEALLKVFKIIEDWTGHIDSHINPK